MGEREDRLRRREAVKAAYEGLYAEVSRILFAHDPIGINFEHNTDEYEPEVDTILPRLGELLTVADTERVLHEEFVRWFGWYEAGPQERYRHVAVEVWEACQRFRAGAAH